MLDKYRDYFDIDPEYFPQINEKVINNNPDIWKKFYPHETFVKLLKDKGIAISTGSACDSVNTQVSHVIQAIRVPEEYAYGTIRISFGRDNEESDAVEIAKAIVDILKTK